IACLLVVIAAIAASRGYHSLTSSSSTPASPIDALRSEHRRAHDEALPSTVWPAYGQAAVQIGQSQVQAGPNQHATAIASVAKVMTAYLVLRDHPLQPARTVRRSRSPMPMSPTPTAGADSGSRSCPSPPESD